MVYPDLEKNQMGQKQDELLNATIEKDFLKTEILPKYQKFMGEYKVHMTEKGVKQLEDSELITYLLDEYELEEGSPIKVDVKDQWMRYGLASQSEFLEEIHDYYTWYVWVNGAYGWLWNQN